MMKSPAATVQGCRTRHDPIWSTGPSRCSSAAPDSRTVIVDLSEFIDGPPRLVASPDRRRGRRRAGRDRWSLTRRARPVAGADAAVCRPLQPATRATAALLRQCARHARFTIVRSFRFTLAMNTCCPASSRSVRAIGAGAGRSVPTRVTSTRARAEVTRHESHVLGSRNGYPSRSRVTTARFAALRQYVAQERRGAHPAGERSRFTRPRPRGALSLPVAGLHHPHDGRRSGRTRTAQYRAEPAAGPQPQEHPCPADRPPRERPAPARCRPGAAPDPDAGRPSAPPTPPTPTQRQGLHGGHGKWAWPTGRGHARSSRQKSRRCWAHCSAPRLRTFSLTAPARDTRSTTRLHDRHRPTVLVPEPLPLPHPHRPPRPVAPEQHSEIPHRRALHHAPTGLGGGHRRSPGGLPHRSAQTASHRKRGRHDPESRPVPPGVSETARSRASSALPEDVM